MYKIRALSPSAKFTKFHPNPPPLEYQKRKVYKSSARDPFKFQLSLIYIASFHFSNLYYEKSLEYPPSKKGTRIRTTQAREISIIKFSFILNLQTFIQILTCSLEYEK